VPVSFDKAYWYTNECPLRMLNVPVIEEHANAKETRSFIHDILLSSFEEFDGVNTITIIDKLNIPSIKNKVDSVFLARNLQHVIINYGIWKSKHRQDLVLDNSIKDVVNYMEFSVDIARYKKEGEFLQLIWFRYDKTFPSLLDFTKLVQKAQWNARAYELHKKIKPMQLTYYFPVLGDEYSVLYNSDNNYDKIASLINDEVFYTKPSEVCDICTGCPMTWVGFNDRQ